MKYSIFFLILSFFYITCGNSNAPEVSKQEMEPKQEKVSKTKSKSSAKETGFFEITIDGKTFKSTNFEKNYCDMHFMYNGDKSVLTVRIKDDETNNAMLINIYGTESFIDSPSSKISNIRPKDKELPAVMLSYIEGGQYGKKTFGDGEFNIEEFSKGKIVGSFKGSGGELKDILTGEKLTQYEGKFSLTTELIREVRL